VNYSARWVNLIAILLLKVAVKKAEGCWQKNSITISMNTTKNLSHLVSTSLPQAIASESAENGGRMSASDEFNNYLNEHYEDFIASCKHFSLLPDSKSAENGGRMSAEEFNNYLN
jgi:hypothetical protein